MTSRCGSRTTKRPTFTFVHRIAPGGAFERTSMRHQVKDDVDAKGISHSLGELVEVIFVLTLPFPTIADVAVVDGENHNPLAVVEQRPDVHFLGAFSTVNPLERR